MTNKELYEKAVEAIEALYNDDSISAIDNMTNMEMLIQKIKGLGCSKNQEDKKKKMEDAYQSLIRGPQGD